MSDLLFYILNLYMTEYLGILIPLLNEYYSDLGLPPVRSGGARLRVTDQGRGTSGIGIQRRTRSLKTFLLASLKHSPASLILQ